MWHDLHMALRTQHKGLAFAATAVITLALGIAANSTVFGWIDVVLLRPIPGIVHPSRLFVLEAISPGGARMSQVTHPDFRDFQNNLTLADGVTATHVTFFSLGDGDRKQRALGQVVSANFFTVLGVKPFLGRLLLPAEDRDDRAAYPIAVISHRLWRTYFRSDPRVVGRPFRINGRKLTIVGVASPDFRGTVGGASLDIWVPLSMIVEMGGLNTWAAVDRNARFLDVLVRLKPGVSLEEARAEVSGESVRIATAYPRTHRGIGASLAPIWRATYGLQASLLNPLRLLMLVCGLVLLIACANVSSLLMAHSVTRQREFGIRLALGASGARVMRQLLAEVLVLAGIAALLGILAAQWMQDSLQHVLPAVDPLIRAAMDPLLHPEPSTLILAFTVLISVGAGVLAAMLPAAFVARVNVFGALREGGRGATIGARSHRARETLVVAEVALAAVALVGAGLAVRSFHKLSSLDLGFDSSNVLVAHLYLSTNGYPLAQERRFSRDIRLRLESVPGIERVVSADSVPLSFFHPSSERIQIDGSTDDREGVFSLPRAVVTPGYFDLMRIPILAGRDFTEQDDAAKPRVIIVNEAFAQRYFTGQDPIGRVVRVSGVPSRIVGLVRTSKYSNPPEPPTPFFYGPFRQIFFSGHNHFLYIRTNGDMEASRLSLRREITALDSGATYDLETLSESTQAGLFAERIIASLLSVLGFFSLALAAAGLYSVMAYTVSERTLEIGIRMAVGAAQGKVLRMVLRSGLRLATAGLALGLTGAFVFARVVSSSLNIPVALDLEVFAATGLFLILVALGATYIPARRATLVDPLHALRGD